jgi:hypothetical protein
VQSVTRQEGNHGHVVPVLVDVIVVLFGVLDLLGRHIHGRRGGRRGMQGQKSLGCRTASGGDEECGGCGGSGEEEEWWMPTARRSVIAGCLGNVPVIFDQDLKM